jgi:hypothetical protein
MGRRFADEFLGEKNLGRVEVLSLLCNMEFSKIF